MAGVMLPSISSMLGLEAPARIQAAIFGLAATSTAVGFTVGPLVGGSVAALYNPSIGLLAAAAVALVLVVLLTLTGREPASAAPAR